jgi:hypothetical protein
VIWFLSCQTCWLVPILLDIGSILFKFMVYGWDWHMMHTCVLWYVDDGDWCVSELIFTRIFFIVKFGQHHICRIDTMGLFSSMHIRCSMKCLSVISLPILMFLLLLCACNLRCQISSYPRSDISTFYFQAWSNSILHSYKQFRTWEVLDPSWNKRS